jgi:hypothetical protein
MSNGSSVLTKKDPLGDFAKRKVAESDARMKKINPKGRKLDKNGNPIVTKEELEKSGMSLRDFLNKERGLTRRKDAPATAAPKVAPSKDILAPLKGPAVNADPMGDAARDRAIMTDEARKRKSAPRGAGPSDAEVTRAKEMTAKAQEEKYGSGLKMGGKVKGYKSGGSPGMHRMPNGKMMEDSAHKKHGGKVKGYSGGGGVRGAGIAKRGLGSGRMC